MSTKEQYSFWCSTCKFSHPGECSSIKSIDNTFKIGDVLRLQARHKDDTKWIDKIINHLYTIIEISTNEIRYMGNTTKRETKNDIKIISDTGVSDGNYFVRLIKTKT